MGYQNGFLEQGSRSENSSNRAVFNRQEIPLLNRVNARQLLRYRQGLLDTCL